MPRIEGVSSTTFERPILLRPRAFSVSFWPGLRPIGLPVWVILIFAIVPDPLLAGFGSRIAALAEDVAHLLGATGRDRTRRVAMLERIERRLDHVVRVRGADRLGDDVMDAERLEDRANRTAGDDAGTGLGRTDDHATGAEVPVGVV